MIRSSIINVITYLLFITLLTTTLAVPKAEDDNQNSSVSVLASGLETKETLKPQTLAEACGGDYWTCLGDCTKLGNCQGKEQECQAYCRCSYCSDWAGITNSACIQSKCNPYNPSSSKVYATLNYNWDGGCGNWANTVDVTYRFNGKCANYYIAGTWSSNIGWCGAEKCGCSFYDGENCSGTSKWTDASNGNGGNCQNNDGIGFRSFKCSFTL